MNNNEKGFRQFLSESRKEVDSWPQWKKESLSSPGLYREGPSSPVSQKVHAKQKAT